MAPQIIGQVAVQLDNEVTKRDVEDQLTGETANIEEMTQLSNRPRAFG